MHSSPTRLIHSAMHHHASISAKPALLMLSGEMSLGSQLREAQSELSDCRETIAQLKSEMKELKDAHTAAASKEFELAYVKGFNAGLNRTQL